MSPCGRCAHTYPSQRLLHWHEYHSPVSPAQPARLHPIRQLPRPICSPPLLFQGHSKDVHKKMLAVVVSDVEVDGEYQFERVRYSSSPEHLRFLADWLIAQQVEEVVMESTAQYWKPVWGALERYWKPICQKREDGGPKSGTLHLAQAQSNRGPRGRKRDFPD